MVLGELSVPGRPTQLDTVGHGPIGVAICAGGGCLDISSLVYHFSLLSPSLWETVRYRLVYSLKGRSTQNNQPTKISFLCPQLRS